MTHKQPYKQTKGKREVMGCRTVKEKQELRSSKSAWRDEAGTGEERGASWRGVEREVGGFAFFYSAHFLWDMQRQMSPTRPHFSSTTIS